MTRFKRINALLAKISIWQRPNRPHGAGAAGNGGDRLHLLFPLRFARSVLETVLDSFFHGPRPPNPPPPHRVQLIP